jgi:predicted amidohydrolase
MNTIIDTIYNSVKKDDTDIVVFPELFLIGYYSKDLIYKLAEPVDGPHITKIAEASREYGVYTIFGFAEHDEKYDVFYNSAAFVSDNGDISVYRKIHIPDFSIFDEYRYFRKWDGGIELYGVKGFPIGIIICYDVFYPELSRAYTLLGAKAIVAISASPDFSRPLFHDMIKARAIENTIYYIWVNMVGTFDGVGFAGGSRVAEPLGSILYDAPLIKENVKTVAIDTQVVRASREKRPVLKDLSLTDLNLLNDSFHFLIR